MQTQNNPEVPVQNPESHVSEQQKQEAIRDFLFKEFHEKYKAVSSALEHAPLHPLLKEKAATFLDTAFLWAKEAFTVMSFAPAPQVVGKTTVEELQNNVVELPRKKRKYTMKKKNGKRRST